MTDNKTTSSTTTAETEIDAAASRKQQRVEEQHKLLVEEGVLHDGIFPDFTVYCRKQVRNATRCNEMNDLIRFEEWHPKTRTGTAASSDINSERGPLLRFFLGRSPVQGLEERRADCKRVYDEYKDCKREWSARLKIAVDAYEKEQNHLNKVSQESTQE